MSDQGKANYEAYRKLAGQPGVSAAPLPEYDQLPMELAYAFDAGAYAVEQWLAEAPADEDAPGNEPPKVIIVTEKSGRERLYAADEWDSDGASLEISRKTGESGMEVTEHRIVGEYAPGAWLSVREDGALVPDATRRALGIARRALEAITRISDPNVAIELAMVALEEITEAEL